MSSKSNQNSLNTVLGKLTINNDYDVNATGYNGAETTISPSEIIINGNAVSTATFKAITIAHITNVPYADTVDYVIALDDYDYYSTNTTVPVWSFYTTLSFITVANVVINVDDNTITFIFSNDSTDTAGDVTGISLFLYTPSV